MGADRPKFVLSARELQSYHWRTMVFRLSEMLFCRLNKKNGRRPFEGSPAVVQGESLAFFAGVLYAQVVSDLTKTQASLTRTDARDILFHIIVDYAL